MRRLPSALVSAGLAALAASACESEPRACYAGDVVACACDGGAGGFARCGVEATFGACDCAGGVPGVDASSLDAGGDVDAAPPKLALYAPCAEDSQCESGLCYAFNAKGPRCSKPCSGAADCPAPSPGCNGKGICKAP